MTTNAAPAQKALAERLAPETPGAFIAPDEHNAFTHGVVE